LALGGSSGGNLQGAWADPSMDCGAVFSQTRKGVTFKKPPDPFANAFIISGRRLTTPGASCQIQSMKAVENGRRRLSLSCATSVAVDAASVELAVASDGSLQRYSSDTDKTGSRYLRCFP
jgi:hypothetical protein